MKTFNESASCSGSDCLGGLVGIGVIVVTQLLAVGQLDKALTVSLYCFVVSIPLLSLWLSIGLFPGVIRRAGQRAGLHMFESEVHADVAPAIEFCGSDVALDW